MTTPDWRTDALCATTAPDLFTPEVGASLKDAKRICAMCPVRQQCLEYAIANGETQSVWGGKSPKQRRAMRRASAA